MFGVQSNYREKLVEWFFTLRETHDQCWLNVSALKFSWDARRLRPTILPYIDATLSLQTWYLTDLPKIMRSGVEPVTVTNIHVHWLQNQPPEPVRVVNVWTSHKALHETFHSVWNLGHLAWDADFLSISTILSEQKIEILHSDAKFCKVGRKVAKPQYRVPSLTFRCWK